MCTSREFCEITCKGKAVRFCAHHACHTWGCHAERIRTIHSGKTNHHHTYAYIKKMVGLQCASIQCVVMQMM